MDATFGCIIGKFDDYKICKDCGGYNWYENDSCPHCMSRPQRFRRMTQKDADNLADQIVDFNKENPNLDETHDEHWCMECTTEI